MVSKPGPLSKSSDTAALSPDVPEAYRWTHEAFRTLDVLTRCPICGDHFRAPMSLACAHTFCSECIRRAFSYRSECPECRAASSTGQLRKNRLVEEITVAWQRGRGQVLHESLQSRRKDGVSEETGHKTDLKDKAATVTATIQGTRIARGPATRARSQSAPAAETVCGKSVKETYGIDPASRPAYDGASSDADEKSLASAVSVKAPGSLSETLGTEVVTAAIRREKQNAACSSWVQPDSCLISNGGSVHNWLDANAGCPSRASANPALYTTETDTESSPESETIPCSQRVNNRQAQQKELKRHIACPICSHPYPQAFIQAHVDECLNQLDAKEARNNGNMGRHPSARHPARLEYPVRKIPEVWYDGQSERRLRAMIEALGLNIPPFWQRHRQGLIYLHREYVVRHNAECDIEPLTARKSLRQICKEVEELAWSRIQAAPPTARHDGDTAGLA